MVSSLNGTFDFEPLELEALGYTDVTAA